MGYEGFDCSIQIVYLFPVEWFIEIVQVVHLRLALETAMEACSQLAVPRKIAVDSGQ